MRYVYQQEYDPKIFCCLLFSLPLDSYDAYTRPSVLVGFLHNLVTLKLQKLSHLQIKLILEYTHIPDAPSCCRIMMWQIAMERWMGHMQMICFSFDK
jgi:hypothetical protein